jgi:CRP-like cAMP-binding protein
MMKKITDSSVAQELQRLHRAHFTGDLLKHSVVRTYDRNEPLLHQGATVSHLLILLAGKARIVQQEPNGKNTDFAIS